MSGPSLMGYDDTGSNVMDGIGAGYGKGCRVLKHKYDEVEAK
jgi:hypothetical protein